MKFCLKIGEPSSNPKYVLVIDRVLVARAKDEKNPERGSEIDSEIG